MPPIIRTSQVVAVGSASAKFTNAMVPGMLYRFAANTNCWVLVGATGASAAAATANNHYVHAGQTVWLTAESSTDGFVHVIRDSTDGNASLSEVEGVS